MIHKFHVKYDGFKEVDKMVAVPEKSGIVALIDVDKGNMMDVVIMDTELTYVIMVLIENVRTDK